MNCVDFDIDELRRNIRTSFPLGFNRLQVPTDVSRKRTSSKLRVAGLYATSSHCPYGKNLPVLWTNDGFFVLGLSNGLVLWIDSTGGGHKATPQMFGLRRINPLDVASLRLDVASLR